MMLVSLLRSSSTENEQTWFVLTIIISRSKGTHESRNECACGSVFVHYFLFLYLSDDGDLVVIANGVFAQEVEFHHTLTAFQLLVEGDVLDA